MGNGMLVGGGIIGNKPPMTTKIRLTNQPQQIVDSENWALISSSSGEDFKIHVGASVSSVDAFHLIRDISFGVGVQVWAWTDSTSPLYVSVSQG